MLTTSLHFVFLSDESLLMRLYKNGIRLIEVSGLFLPTYVHLLHAQYLHSAWFLDGRTSIHIILCRQEHARYYKNRQLATEKPTEYLSLIVDGMDQNEANIPSLVSLYDKLSTRLSLELGGTQISETVWYFIKYHNINNYYILINTFMRPVKYSNNFSQVTSV